MLEIVFKKLQDLGKVLLELAPHVAEGVDSSEIELLGCTKNITSQIQIIADLVSVAQEVDLNDRLEVAKVTKPATVTTTLTVGSVYAEKSNLVKLKVSPPTFS